MRSGKIIMRKLGNHPAHVVGTSKGDFKSLQGAERPEHATLVDLAAAN